MKKLLTIIGILISLSGYSQIADIYDGESGLSVMNKLNTVLDYVNDSTVTFNDSTTVFVTPTQLEAVDAMVYPGAGIALSTGTAWGTSITDNSGNWNTAYDWGDWAAGVPAAVMEFTNKSGSNSQWTNDEGYITGNETITLSGDVTGSGATAITTSIGTNVIDDTHIDFGTGAGQVSTDDLTEGSTNLYNQIHTGDVTGSTALTIATGSVGADELESTAVTPGSYTTADITVDADGRLTAASSGSGGTSVSFGADNQIPYTNGTTDDFDYTSNFTFDGTDFTVPASVNADKFNTTTQGTQSINTATTLDTDDGADSETLTLGGDLTLSVHNVDDGQEGYIEVRQDATGDRTLTLAFYSDAGNTGLTEVYFSVDEVDQTASYYTTIHYTRLGSRVIIEMMWTGS